MLGAERLSDANYSVGCEGYLPVFCVAAYVRGAAFTGGNSGSYTNDHTKPDNLQRLISVDRKERAYVRARIDVACIVLTWRNSSMMQYALYAASVT